MPRPPDLPLIGAVALGGTKGPGQTLYVVAPPTPLPTPLFLLKVAVPAPLVPPPNGGGRGRVEWGGRGPKVFFFLRGHNSAGHISLAEGE